MDRDPITMINRRRLLAESLTACSAREVRDVVAQHLIARHGERAAHEAMCIADATVETPDAWAQSYDHTELEELDAPMRLHIGGWILALALAAAAAWGVVQLIDTASAATAAQIAAGAVEW